jgi:hypothetical protein
MPASPALVYCERRLVPSIAGMALLQITLQVDPADRPAAADVYARYKQPFLDTIEGATAKDLLVRDEDVQVLHAFDTAEQAQAYLRSPLFTDDVVTALGPLLAAAPDIRVYDVA